MKKIVWGILSMITLIACSNSGSLDKATYDKLADGLYANIKTNQGDMLVQLEFEKTPVTVANFVGLAEGKIENKAKKKGEKFYEKLTFHRVIKDFMIQGGDPDGTGSGGPGYTFADEVDSTLTFDKKGILAMANSGPATNGSQFFITDAATPFLNGKHTIFGHVVNGMDIITKIASVKKGMGDKPETAVVINKIEIIRKGAKAKKFDAAKVFAARNDQEMTQKSQAMGMQMQQKARELMLAKMKADAVVKQKELKDYLAKAQSTPSGLKYVILQEGTGEVYKMGENATVHYNLFLEDGMLLDSSYKRGQPLQFQLAEGGMIKGFLEAVTTFKKGSKVMVIVPPSLGYGNRENGPIKANSTLYFEIEIL